MVPKQKDEDGVPFRLINGFFMGGLWHGPTKRKRPSRGWTFAFLSLPQGQGDWRLEQTLFLVWNVALDAFNIKAKTGQRAIVSHFAVFQPD